MPYVLVSTQITVRDGPCVVGDEHGDPDVMNQLDATYTKQLGNNYGEWITQRPPTFILNKLETLGYIMTAMTGVGQTCIWSCFKPLEKPAIEQNLSESETNESDKNEAGAPDVSVSNADELNKGESKEDESKVSESKTDDPKVDESNNSESKVDSEQEKDSSDTERKESAAEQ